MRERLLVVQFLFVLSVFISSLGTSVAGAKGSEIPPLVEATKAQGQIVNKGGLGQQFSGFV